MAIKIELDTVEAHLVLGAIAGTRIDETIAAATADPDVKEWAAIRVGVLGRVAARIADQMIPAEKSEAAPAKHPGVARAEFERWATGG